MKVITKYVNIENEEFVLIKDEDSNYGEYYGTIPYAEMDEDGRLKRTLNGFEMRVGHTIAEALEERKQSIIVNRRIDEYLAQGFEREMAILKAYDLA